MQRFTAQVNGRVITIVKMLFLLDLAERFGLPTLCEAASRVHAYTIGEARPRREVPIRPWRPQRPQRRK